jgi:hypothetical protein
VIRAAIEQLACVLLVAAVIVGLLIFATFLAIVGGS